MQWACQCEKGEPHALHRSINGGTNNGHARKYAAQVMRKNNSSGLVGGNGDTATGTAFASAHRRSVVAQERGQWTPTRSVLQRGPGQQQGISSALVLLL